MGDISKKIVITGASGNLGCKLRTGLAPRDDLSLVLIDRDPRGDPAVIAADLGDDHPDWTRMFEGADVVVHLAANPDPFATWGALLRDNIDATINVFETAVGANVKRVILASSLRVMVGYADKELQVTTTLPPNPVTAYDVSKLLGERLGKSYATRHGLSVICLRIGALPENELFPLSHWRRWERDTWLSPRDFCRAVEQAIDVADVPYAVLNLASRCDGGHVDLKETGRVIGYESQDHWSPSPPKFLSALKNSLRRKKPGLASWARRN